MSQSSIFVVVLLYCCIGWHVSDSQHLNMSEDIPMLNTDPVTANISTSTNHNWNFQFNLGGLESDEIVRNMENNFHGVFESLYLNFRTITNVQDNIDTLMYNSIEGSQSVHEGLKNNHGQIVAEIDDVNNRVERPFANILGLLRVSSEIYNSAEKMRFEMLDEFQKSFQLARNSRIEPALTRMNHFILYFNKERARISQLSTGERVAFLSRENGFVHYLRESRTPSGDSLQTFLNEVIEKKYAIPQTPDDNVAYAALSSMYYGVLTFISVLRYVTLINLYLSDHYYRNLDTDAFNQQFDHMVGDYKSFHHTLTGHRGLIADAKRVLNDVAAMGFARNKGELMNRSAILERLHLQLENTETALPIIREVPGKIVKIKFDNKSLPTPISQWTDGAKVSYAVQYVNGNGLFSKLGKWSNPVAIHGRANPILRLPGKLPYIQLLFRKFNNDAPQMVGWCEPIRAGDCRDIDVDLFYVAGGPEESLAIAEAKAYISIGANPKASFDLGRSAVHAAAINGNTKLARTLLLNDSEIVNMKDANDYTPLHLAAEGGWADFVEMLIIEKGADINAKTIFGSTPLHLAVSNGNINEFMVLSETEDVNVNAQQNNGNGPIHIAVMNREKTILNMLLVDDRTNVNLQTIGNLTPLHLSIYNGTNEITQKLLLDSRTKVNVRSNGNLTALHHAVISGNIPALQMLIYRDATDVNSQSVNNWTPLHYAVLLKRKDLVSLLLKRKDLIIDVPAVCQVTPLHLAAANGENEMIKELVSHGARINFPNCEGMSPIHLAAINGNYLVLKSLLEMSAKINAKNDLGCTVLHLMAAKGDMKATQIILNAGKGVQLDLQNNDGMTALHLAADNGNEEVMGLLLEQGANVNSRNSQGSTILHLMAARRDVEAVKMILDKGKGVQLNMQNNEGLTAIQLAAGNNKIIKCIRDKMKATRKGDWGEVNSLVLQGADKGQQSRDHKKNTALLRAADAGNVDEVRSLVEMGAQLEAKNDIGDTPLIRAVLQGNLEVVQYLVEKGADVDARDNGGITPLTTAATHGRLEVVRYLVEKGANVDAKDNNGFNPLIRAAMNGSVDIVRFLLEKGASTKHNVGYSALFFAVKLGRLELIRCLIDKGAPLHSEVVIPAAAEGKVEVVQYLVEKGARLDAKDKDGNTPLIMAAQKGHLEVVRYLVEKGAQLHVKNNYDQSALSIAICNDHRDVAKYLCPKVTDPWVLICIFM